TLAPLPAQNIAFTTATIAAQLDPEGGNLNPASPEEVMPIEWNLQVSPENEVGEFVEWSTVGGGGILSGDEATGTDPTELTYALDPTPLRPAPSSRSRLRVFFAVPLRPLLDSAESPTFTTQAVSPPAVSIEPVSAITATSAHLSGMVEIENEDLAFNANCAFQ